MADEPLTIRGISWRQTFPFINLFRAFRVAVHPSKIVLALVALILLYIGGNLLDLFWSVPYRAVPNEVALYGQFASHAKPGQKFDEVRKASRDQIESAYAQQLINYKIESDLPAALHAAHDGAELTILKARILDQRRQAEASASNAKQHALASGQAPDAVDRDYTSAVRQAFSFASSEYQSALQIKNVGLFESYFDYESNQISNVVHAVQDWNWFGQEHSPDTGLAFPDGLRSDIGLSTPPGVLQSTVRFFTVAPIWLLTQHPLFFAIFGLLSLALWSLFGGAICRIAAVHVARDEKLSIRSALMFSGGKFLSFLFAPIIPLLIVVGVGLLVTVGSAVANIPYFGPIVVGAVFILALAAGFIMSLVLLGLIGGFNLMYPTVAVEGSDSFDAISRSFSYLYARPWRLGFYTLVSVVYGAAAYLFVRFFIFLMLVLAHKFGGLAVVTSAPSTAPLWSSLWPDPSTSGRLSYEIDTLSLTFAQEIGARLIWLWVYLIIAMLGAFTVSFYFSANTIIYYLMRREVDATDLDDVYLEQIDDEFADPIVADAPAPEPAANKSAAGATPPEASTETSPETPQSTPPT
jgi:hypothetical protein